MRPLHEVLLEAAARPSVSHTSRRGVFALAAAAPIAFGLESVLAQTGAEQQNRGRRNRGGRRKGDIAVLNYALTLEHLEYAFYRDALEGPNAFTENAFNAFDDRDPQLFARLQEIKQHEGAHVDALIATIQQLGGKPVEELCYDFGYSTVPQFLAVAQALENTGVSAYDGAIADIKSPRLQTTGATIATVEARHAAYLNFINGENPFPDAFDTPLDKADVLDIAGQFITGDQPCND